MEQATKKNKYVRAAKIKGSRYKKLIADGKMLKIILCDVVDGEYFLPEKYERHLHFKGISIDDATYEEAADYYHKQNGEPKIPEMG